jgi:hypothetical protein
MDLLRSGFGLIPTKAGGGRIVQMQAKFVL